MKQITLAIVISALLSTSAIAQPSQGQAAGQAGVNGNTSTATDSATSSKARNGTIGMGSGNAPRAGSERDRLNGSPGMAGSKAPPSSPESRGGR